MESRSDLSQLDHPHLIPSPLLSLDPISGMATSIWRSSTIDVFIGDGGECILTTVTASGEEVEYWLDEILDIHRRRLRRLVVGLDTEWRPGQDNPVALLQLCVGRRCLLFQIIHADYIPDDLIDFLSDDRFTFVGVNIQDDAKRLEKYNLKVSNTADLRQLAVEKMERPDLCRVGLQKLVREVMGIYIPKQKEVSLSDWNNRRLTDDQITYAAVDAFTSFEVGRRLIAGRERDRSEDYSKVNMSDPVVDTSNLVLTKHQLGQRAHWEQERSEANTIISSSHGGITLTTHSEANPIEISNSDLSKHQLGQRACQERERLESKQTISTSNGGTTLTTNLEGHSEANISVPNIETSNSGNAAVAEGTLLRMPRLPCCGIDTGWLLFFIGFFLAAIPWYVGAFILLVKTDYREKPGFIACTIAAVLATTAVMPGVTKGADAW